MATSSHVSALPQASQAPQVTMEHLNAVPPEGPLSARIIIIGEAPGRTERSINRPFMGASGNLLKRMWADPSVACITTIRREDVYIDNFCPWLPESRHIESLTPQEMIECRNALHARLACLSMPVVIVPTGNYACWALVGKGNVKGVTLAKMDKIGITSLRGSIYALQLNGRTVKVIPTLHPSAVFNRGSRSMGATKGSLEKRSVRDWARIAVESLYEGLIEPNRVHCVDPMESEVQAFYNLMCDNPECPIACDIETWGNKLSCVGFSHHPQWSITLRTDNKQHMTTFAPWIRALLQLPNPKVFQNGLYDCYWLHHTRYAMPVNAWLYDTMYMHHCFESVDSHDLAYLSSIYLPFHRYWKDEAKEAEEIVKYAQNSEILWRYNGMDCCATRELYDYINADLVRENMLAQYFQHYAVMYEPLIATMLQGVRIDESERARLYASVVDQCKWLRELLTTYAGEDLYAKTDFSRTKLMRLFHETLALPRKFKMTRKKDGERSMSVSLDNTSLAKYAHQWPEKCEEIVSMIVQHRGKAKWLTWLGEDKVDKDGRVRCQYTMNTEAMRLSSKSNPMRTGYNLQNSDRDVRTMYVPDLFDY